MSREERMGRGDLSSGEGQDPEGRLGFPWGGIPSVILVGEKEVKVGGGLCVNMQVLWLKVDGFCFLLEGHLLKGQGKEEKGWRF